jgi:hypothetical protein
MAVARIDENAQYSWLSVADLDLVVLSGVGWCCDILKRLHSVVGTISRHVEAVRTPDSHSDCLLQIRLVCVN